MQQTTFIRVHVSIQGTCWIFYFLFDFRLSRWHEPELNAGGNAERISFPSETRSEY